MPSKPKALGYLAKSVATSVCELLDESDYDYPTLQRLISQRDWEEAMLLTEKMAIRNKISSKALHLLIQNEIRASEQLLIDKENRSNGNHHE